MTSSARVCLAQINVLPGKPRENLGTMLSLLASPRLRGVDLVVFPEMAVPGYLIADEWERNAFLLECQDCTHELVQASKGRIVIFGNVAVDRTRRNEDGRVRKYNALFVAEDGHLVSSPDSLYPFVVKTLMPNYRQFDDSRHFYDSRKLAQERNVDFESLICPIPTRIGRLGCMICEDLWDPDYGISPMKLLAGKQARLFVNISASPFTVDKNNKRRRLMNAAACRYHRPLIYCNKVGIQNNGKTIYTFDGHSCIYDGHGHFVEQSAAFIAEPLHVDLPLDGHPFGKPVPLAKGTIRDTAEALIFGTRAFMEQLAVERAVVGVSGGVDSALCAALLSRCIPPDQLVLINMPSRYNSPTTIRLARQLAENLHARYAEVPIEESVALTHRQIDGLRLGHNESEPSPVLRLNETILENVQARDRSSRVLAVIAAAWGGVFSCNANKSELTVGYGTLYGDICGFMAPLGDLWKTEVWEMARFFNSDIFEREVIPEGTIRLIPSAELGPSQNVDLGRGDPLVYPYHDRLFASWVEQWHRATPEENLDGYRRGRLEKQLDYPGKIGDLFKTPAEFIADLERWWNLYQGMALAKRIQAPPVLAVKRRAFGFDHRESQIGPRYTKRYLNIKAELLENTHNPSSSEP